MDARSKSGAVSLLGIPDHEGVIRLAGRVGAAKGPAAFRAALSRMRVARELLGIEFRDVRGLGVDSRANLKAAAEALARLHAGNPRTIVVGGSHEHGFSQLAGIRTAFPGERIGCVNIDAHLDLRPAKPEITSGSPFWLAIEEGVIEPTHLVELGIQEIWNGEELRAYSRAKGVEVATLDGMRESRGVLTSFSDALVRLASRVDRVVLSVDLDALAAAHAPGVSAPPPDGLTPGELFAMVRVAAANPRVVSLGIFELNPEHDRDEMTARLAVQAAWEFARSPVPR